MHVRKEAVLSSMIEGTQSSLSDLLLFELDQEPGVPPDDVREVSNYVAALDSITVSGVELDSLGDFSWSARVAFPSSLVLKVGCIWPLSWICIPARSLAGLGHEQADEKTAFLLKHYTPAG
jgi:hypothetical protein